ncbi:tetratricopeptide repeat protein [Mesorhizobium sp. 10J20-29]
MNSVALKLNSSQAPDLSELEQVVYKALRFDAVDARLVSLLGEIHYRQGRTGQAQANFEAALDISKTELHALQRTIGLAIQDQDYSRAIDRMDILLRRWPDRLNAITELFAVVLASDVGYRKVRGLLAEAPPWRNGLFRTLAAYPQALPAAARLLQDLTESPHPPRVAEVSSITGSLIREKMVPQAYRLFLLTLSEQERAVGGYIHNGGFEGPLTGRPFDWQLHDQPGYRLVAPARAGAGSGLEIQFGGTPVKRIGLQQYLQLSVGTYVLEMEITGANANMPKGLFWTVNCSMGGKEIAKLDVPEGTYAARKLQAKFSVEEESCPLQVLTLNTSAIAGSWKNRYSGRIKFRGLRIEKVLS